MVRKPVTTQAPIRSAGELTSLPISAETIKMPEPIIEPMTSMVALVSPRPFTNSLSCLLWRSQSVAALDGLGSVVTALPDACLDAGDRRASELHGTLPQYAEKFLC